MTPARKNIYALAERLGMTVWEMESKLPVSELLGWIDYFRPEEEKLKDSSEILSVFGLK